ncbi:hypothetical protein ENBRE01_0773 [Enteropsectra breve]|nr:hypothetical protein ENBRE01_0773 [Enteropsectra breve]
MAADKGTTAAADAKVNGAMSNIQQNEYMQKIPKELEKVSMNKIIDGFLLSKTCFSVLLSMTVLFSRPTLGEWIPIGIGWIAYFALMIDLLIDAVAWFLSLSSLFVIAVFSALIKNGLIFIHFFALCIEGGQRLKWIVTIISCCSAFILDFILLNYYSLYWQGVKGQTTQVHEDEEEKI